VKTFRLTTLNEAITVATTLTKSWFRGHSRAIGELVPRLYRPEFRDPALTAFRPDLEMTTVEAFKRHAPMLADIHLPAENDRFGWLCVMQHYRTPTRLLDWTENALVALHFAVSADLTEDGEVWAMLPWALNQAARAGWGIPIVSESRHVEYLVGEAYWQGKPEKLAEKVGLSEPVQSPIAVEPTAHFARVAVQAATFTIHPYLENSRGIADVLTEPKHLVRYIVPAAAKQALSQHLRVLGFSDRHLFPDLEGLSRMIVSGNRMVGYGPPDPPECSGEIRDDSEDGG